MSSRASLWSGRAVSLLAVGLVTGAALDAPPAKPGARAGATRAPVSLRASVSPSTVRVPKTRVLRHSLRITNRSSRQRRFAVEVSPSRFSELEGSTMQPLSTRLRGPGSLSPRGSLIGDFIPCSFRLRVHSATAYAEQLVVRVPPRSSTIVVAAFRRIGRPSRETDLTVEWRVRGRGRPRTVRSRRPRIAGRPAAGIEFMTSPPTRRRGDTRSVAPIAHNQPLTLSGRVHDAVAGHYVKLYYAGDSEETARSIAGLRTASDGSFRYRWNPPLPLGRLEIWAEVSSGLRAAGDFACSRFGTVKAVP